MDRARFWRLFLRQFAILTTVSLGLVAIFYVEHAIPARPQIEWLEFFALDLTVLVGASALSAWLRLKAEERRRH